MNWSSVAWFVAGLLVLPVGFTLIAFISALRARREQDRQFTRFVDAMTREWETR